LVNPAVTEFKGDIPRFFNEEASTDGIPSYREVKENLSPPLPKPNFKVCQELYWGSSKRKFDPNQAFAIRNSGRAKTLPYPQALNRQNNPKRSTGQMSDF